MAKGKIKGYDSFMEELKRQLQLTGTLRELAPLFGLTEGQIYNLFSQEAQAKVSFLFQVSAKVPTSPTVLLRKGLLDTFESPVNILLALREQAQLPDDPFLDQLSPRLTSLLQSKVDRHLSAASLQPIIESLEERRYQDRTAACEACEELILEIVHHLETRAATKPQRPLGELAAAVALWGTIQRSRGFRDLAVKAFSLAFPLAFSSGDAWAIGTCYYRGAFLLGDLGRSDLAYEFIRDAFIHFSAEGVPLNLWKSHRARGHFLTRNGRLDEAKEVYELALENLPGSEWRDRVSALQGLGVIARRQKKLIQAREVLEAAAGECKRTDLVLGHVLWSQGLVEIDLGNLKDARQYLEKSTALLGKFGSAGDVALICVDLVQVLLEQKDTQRATAIVTEVAGWLPKLRANPILCRAFDKFLDLARATRIELAKLPKQRQAFQEASKRGEAL